MKKPPIGTPPREASEKRLAEEQAKRVPPTDTTDLVERLRFAAEDPAGTDTHVAIYRDLCTESAAEIERLTQERDDAEASGEAMFEKLRPALTIAEAEIERLQAALREAKELLEHGRSVNVAITIINAALSGKGET